LEWQKKCVVENFTDIVNIIRKHRKDLLITGEFGGNSYTPYELIQLCDVLSPNITDRVGEYQPPRWTPTIQTRYALNASNNIPPWMIVAPAPSLTWRHTILPPNELRSWLSQIIANKGNIWHALTGIPDTQKDERILELIGEISQKFDILRPYLENTELKANVAVLESRKNILMNQLPNGKNDYLDELYGFYDALTSGHIPFIPILEENLNIETLNNYKLLILPDSAYLTKGQVKVIKEFFNNGGKILASYRTSLYDENGRELGDFALGEEFGVRFLKNEIKDTLASYMRIEEKHPIFGDIGNTEILPNGESFLQVLPTKSKALLTYVPPFSSPEGVGAPPERASFRTLKTDIPLLILNTNAKAIYFPIKIGALIWKLKMPEHRSLLINTVKWLLGDYLELYINAPSHIYVSLLKGEDFLLVNLANTIGERPLAEIIPVYNIDVKIKCKDRVKE
ncbi:MAG: beta-galactosidase trimerization domain-containing protein, partial [Candidatus Methanomethyliaceae archaeon]|nr:beta-galactosidase trimerization domain-containing protein [Candidatus Methanomethyliaceae archaeon]